MALRGWTWDAAVGGGGGGGGPPPPPPPFPPRPPTGRGAAVPGSLPRGGRPARHAGHGRGLPRRLAADGARRHDAGCGRHARECPRLRAADDLSRARGLPAAPRAGADRDRDTRPVRRGAPTLPLGRDGSGPAAAPLGRAGHAAAVGPQLPLSRDGEPDARAWGP